MHALFDMTIRFYIEYRFLHARDEIAESVDSKWETDRYYTTVML